MERSSFTIQKDFDFPIHSSYEEMHLKPEVLELIKKSNIESPPLLHQHCLPVLLSNNDVLISSPAATGKSALLNIAIHNLLQRKYKNLQFIILEGKDYLVKETYQKMLNFAYDWDIKYCISDKSTALHEDYVPLKNCQIAIASLFKLYGLLSKARRTYDKVRYVIIDAVNYENQKFPKILDMIKQKAPQAKIWWFTNVIEILEPTAHIIENYMPSILKAIVVSDYVYMTWANHFYIQVQNPEGRLEMTKKLLNQAEDIQTVLFCVEDEILEFYAKSLESYFPRIIRANQGFQISEDILNIFSKGLCNVLICSAKQVFARRIKTNKPTYVIISSPVNKKEYEILTRRSGVKNDDNIFTFVCNNDEIAIVEEVTGCFDINLQKWPRINDE
ncbi:hypothetical protein SteCoe_15716 [Stentor coeruleus]|uniref:DEAD/DEAH-box helicase domain-containing protein n=1 Tax=Stentor coeruleus TaxID=5963 RepID=A0A1R2C2X0_9CILI|nr:hypothetical protein SteCoe_15716 [Stentor coeruleus]